tara:strand:+ start:243 stop:422 length:180 start_codon:yes stop_codon:yes gene_type:complete
MKSEVKKVSNIIKMESYKGLVVFGIKIKLTFLLSLTFLISGSNIVNAKQNFGDYEDDIT